jgi:hypothetical protein
LNNYFYTINENIIPFMNNLFRVSILCVLVIVLAACNSPTRQPTGTALLGIERITETQIPDTPRKPKATASPSHTAPVEVAPPTLSASSMPIETSIPPTRPPASPTLRPTLGPEAWKALPVVPDISDRVVEIYQRGLLAGNNPRAFSKIGDCGSTPGWFLGDFDRGPRYYQLGDYTQLSAVIKEFQGSYDRASLAARSGFNASALFVTLWSDRNYCQAGEEPLACEYRVHKPSISFIMLGERRYTYSCHKS